MFAWKNTKCFTFMTSLVKHPKLKNKSNASQQIIVNLQISVFCQYSSKYFVSKVAHGVKSCVRVTQYALFGGTAAQKGLLILPTLVVKKTVAPTSSLEMS